MPGLGSVNGVAILLPMTFLVPPTGAIIFLGAIYYGAMYGGAISSIMLGIPGASTAVATTFDGRPMALQGKADKALVAAAAATRERATAHGTTNNHRQHKFARRGTVQTSEHAVLNNTNIHKNEAQKNCTS